MATVVQTFQRGDFSFPATNPAGCWGVQGTNNPVEGLSFDGNTQQTAFLAFLAQNYGSGNLTIDVEWYASSATSGAIVFGASLQAITPNTDTQDVETDGFATENTAADTHLGTVGKRDHKFSITVSNLDSLANGDACVLRFRRIPADAGDTMTTGLCIVTRVTISYSDT